MAALTLAARASAVLLAAALAEAGAGTRTIAALCGISETAAKPFVRAAGGAGPRSPRDLALWLDQDPPRLLQAWQVLKCHLETDPAQHPAARLLEAYRAYRLLAPTPLLGLNEAWGVVRLYQLGEAHVRICRRCEMAHLVVADYGLCPLCRLVEAMSCATAGCTNLVPEREGPERRGRPRKYCEACERGQRTGRDRRRLGGG